MRVVSPAPRSAWREVLDADPFALPTQTPEWTDWLCRTRRHTDASRLYEFPHGRRMVLPLLSRTWAGVRVAEESMPHGMGNGGVLVPGGKPSSAEAEAVLADLARRPLVRVSLSPNPLVAPTWAAVAPEGALRVPLLGHVLDLEGGFERVWSIRFHKVARKNIRSGQKHGLEIRTDVDDRAVADFTELNRRSVDRWAQQRQQPRWLARLVEQRRDRAHQLASAVRLLRPMLRVWTAHLEGEPVAVNVFLTSGEHVVSWMSAIDKDRAQRTNAGALLKSLAIEDACRGDARWFHFGDSDPGSGVAKFKEWLGAAPLSYEVLRFERLPVTAADQGLHAAAGRVLALRHRRPDGERP
ncbi:GNAT family N-acetyltransferase [Geodermatophilus africanus]|uniref:GNAT family N-acetyltransferase n=1 Tax=Geodermatophilus africanus TaxID=1137993 RepID=UPI00147A003B|nr:GNAT family N-acetyltransferase [Geodermatophilus africanus]